MHALVNAHLKGVNALIQSRTRSGISRMELSTSWNFPSLHHGLMLAFQLSPSPVTYPRPCERLRLIPCSLRASGERPQVRGWLERLLEPGGGLGSRLTPTHLVTAVVYFAGRIPRGSQQEGEVSIQQVYEGEPLGSAPVGKKGQKWDWAGGKVEPPQGSHPTPQGV